MTARRLAPALALLLAACGAPQVRTVAPTAETIAFLKVDPERIGACVRVEEVVIDAVAGMVTGDAEGVVAAQVERGLARCGELAGLIDPAAYPAAQQPRASACRSAFAAKVDAYTALNATLGSEGDFMAAQSGARRFLSQMGEARPLMEQCNTPSA